jgi:hypothetical protein
MLLNIQISQSVKKSFWLGKNGPMLNAEIGGNHKGKKFLV